MNTYRIYYTSKDGIWFKEVDDLRRAFSVAELLDDLECEFIFPTRIYLITATLVFEDCYE